MNNSEKQVELARECIIASLGLIRGGKVEDVIRHSFTSYLRTMFPDEPSWIKQHIEGSESAVKFSKEGKLRTGFVDNLVDLTAIEYESNITNKTKFENGYGQVKDYCASLLNKGYDSELILGVLSDTVRWKAYKIKTIVTPANRKFGRDDIELDEIESIDLSLADNLAGKRLIDFLNTYLGRLGSRPLTASSLANDLGFDSHFCSRHISSLRELVNNAFTQRPEYGEMITNLWCRFVSYLRDKNSVAEFDREMYSDELYILTLAKLVCANIIENRALRSDRDEISAIMQGDFFKVRGIMNLVEYDYFGWLNEGEFLEKIIPVAQEMQEDLMAYNFSAPPADDLFGQIMAQLASRSQRILLGQEWTPKWLASSIVKQVLEKLPVEEFPKLVDMCCGSGALIVEAIEQSKAMIKRNKITSQSSIGLDPTNGSSGMLIKSIEATQCLNEIEIDQAEIELLTQAITGFDIDPLAVMLSKISWLLAARDWLEPFGSFEVTIPVYHADSLFAITPLSDVIGEEEQEDCYQLQIAEDLIKLPKFLISPQFLNYFDTLIDFGYNIAITIGMIEDRELESFVSATLNDSELEVDSAMIVSTKRFLSSFISTVSRLHSEGRNGIWAFILRNSYRPGLVAGQFNGLVSNPPWLALSKIENNPYQQVLKKKAERFGIKPPGPAFLHIEMATTFLLHAVDRYLKSGAVVGCITPETVLNGYNHEPFRQLAFSKTANPVNFELNEIWKLEENTFKNKGIVLFGTKSNSSPVLPNPIPGAVVGKNSLSITSFFMNTQGKRSALSDNQTNRDNKASLSPGSFKQGADIMPRRLLFHEITPIKSAKGIQQVSVKPIEVGVSPLSFIVKDAKKLSDFRINPTVLPSDLFYDVLTSNMLTPFNIVSPVKALLPIRRGSNDKWEPLTEGSLIAKGQRVNLAFKQIFSAMGNKADINTLWNQINTRGKLAQQVIQPGGYLLFTGTSGEKVCSAFLDTQKIDIERLIIDQTLNWATVETLDEACYITGLFNSEAINLMIKDFQPEGAFGGRHIHSLPFRVTPRFDSTQPAHQEVVEKTKFLIMEFQGLKHSDPTIEENLLNPNFSTLARRRKLIKDLIKSLPGYADYELACRNLYGV
uniref:site-specific DNA-methyltransferase (adenine-specific) n=1 Tax=Bacillus sp. R TaxID=243902 RepID=Q6UQ57_9BACI|nr:BseRI endonuclease [Bacillus sp. R]